MNRFFFAFSGCLIVAVLSISDLAAQDNPQRFGGGGPRRGGPFGFNAPPGPPAPVPEQVQIARPTEEEVSKMNALLNEFIESSAEKELLQKYKSLITVKVPRDNPCIRPTPGIRGPRHQAFVDKAKEGGFDILFIGDSITDWWSLEGEGNNAGGKKVFDEYFGEMKVANFGVAGDTTQGILWGLQNGEGQGHKPKAVMLMIGTNNFGGSSAEEVAEGIGADVLELRKNFPDAKIMLVAVFPRGATPNDNYRKKSEEVNKIIAKLDDQQHVFYTDFTSKFINEDGSLVGFRGDQLHPNAEGYKIWAEAVAPTLKSWVQ